jgi:pimeloyl-ACP methyl ester carboxylesterase
MRASGSRTLRYVVAAALLPVLLAGCTSAGSGTGGSSADRSTAPAGASSDVTTPPTPALARFYRQKLVWHDCSGGFQCTRLLVPVDYARPGGATLRIAVDRQRATGDRKGSLLVNPGGPGASGLHYARSAPVDPAVHQRYDVVGFDPRGVGASRSIDCLGDRAMETFIGYDGSPDTPAEVAGWERQGQLLAAGCERNDPTLLAHVGTRDVVRDMDVLRAALGDRRLTYLGKSYGTYIGAMYAAMFPKRVGRLVLDGPLDPALTSLGLARLQAVGFQRALDAFIDDCLGRSSCPFHGDHAGALSRVESLVESLDQNPLPGQGRRVLTQSLGVLGIAGALYDPGSWTFLRRALAQALNGNGESLLLLADLYADRDPDGHYEGNTNDTIYAVNCLDRPTPDLAAVQAAAVEAATVSPIFGPYIEWSNLPCSTWPVPPEGTPAPVTAAGARPILVVGTTNDPATPYESAKGLARELDSGRLLTYVGNGHTAYRLGSNCIDGAVDAYFLHGSLPRVGTRCH